MSDDASPFDRWCYTATDDRFMFDGSPLPVLTVVLLRVCGNDPKRFDVLLEIANR